jgi:hypothetical protein
MERATERAAGRRTRVAKATEGVSP